MITIAFATGPQSPLKPRLNMETHHQNRSEVIIPVLEHVKLDFGTGRVSVYHIMINIAISNMPH